MSLKPARVLTFTCEKCSKPVQVFLQKTSTCSHIAPYLGVCTCGEPRRHATGNADTVAAYLASAGAHWAHQH